MNRLKRCQYDISGLRVVASHAPASAAGRGACKFVFARRGTIAFLSAAIAIMMVGNCFAGIIDYRTGAVIPGTENVTPGMNMLLNGYKLQYAELSNLDLTGSTFANADLSFADLSNSTLSGPGLDPTLVNVDFAGANLTDANLSFVNSDALVLQVGMNFQNTISINTNFTSAELFGADFTRSLVQNSIFDNADLTDVTGLVITTTPEPGTLWLLPAFALCIARRRKAAAAVSRAF